MGASIGSDHFAMVSAYDEWNRVADDASKAEFCRANFLSSDSLQMIQSLRQQFLDRLTDAGFVSEGVNAHSRERGLVRCVIWAGLDPNVAQVVRPVNSKHPGIVTKSKHEVPTPHPTLPLTAPLFC